MNKSILYIGIDPGKEGGIAWKNNVGGLFFTPMPETELDIWKVFTKNFTMTPGICKAVSCIELINPTMTIRTKAKGKKKAGYVTLHATQLFGNYKLLRGFLIAKGIPFEAVPPKVWQKFFKIPPRKKSETTYRWKCRLSATAQELYPNLELWDGTKKEQLKVADAISIVTYCERNYE